MILLLIVILFLVVFPSITRMIGGCLSVVIWTILVVIALAGFGAIPN